MTRFYFRIYQCGDEDGSTIWVDARTADEARAQIKREYHSIDQLLLIKSRKIADEPIKRLKGGEQ